MSKNYTKQYRDIAHWEKVFAENKSPSDRVGMLNTLTCGEDFDRFLNPLDPRSSGVIVETLLRAATTAEFEEEVTRSVGFKAISFISSTMSFLRGENHETKLVVRFLASLHTIKPGLYYELGASASKEKSFVRKVRDFLHEVINYHDPNVIDFSENVTEAIMATRQYDLLKSRKWAGHPKVIWQLMRWIHRMPTEISEHLKVGNKLEEALFFHLGAAGYMNKLVRAIELPD